MVPRSSWYRDANSVPTNPLADELATAPSGHVEVRLPFMLRTDNWKCSNI